MEGGQTMNEKESNLYLKYAVLNTKKRSELFFNTNMSEGSDYSVE